MKKIRNVCIVLGLLLTSKASLALANSPIQRIDVVNMLWNNLAGNGGLTNTAVTLSFSSGGSAPCFTTTLAFQAAFTVWAGVGQPCIAPITVVETTPIEAPFGLVYQAPSNATLNTQFYSTQLTIGQLSAPVFDSRNATLLSAGTVLISTITH